MSNIGKSEVNISYSRNDECSVSDSGGGNDNGKCELQTENIVPVTSNGKQDIFNRARCCGHLNSNVKISISDLSEKNPEFLISTIKELQKKIEYTEKMNWLCKY